MILRRTKPAAITISCMNQNLHQIIPSKISLLTWNVHKENLNFGFWQRLATIQNINKINLFCLQEAKYITNYRFATDYSLHFAANLSFKNHAFGVMTIANIEAISANLLLSQNREFFIRTYKTSLLTSYPINDQCSLLVVNVHAINFKSTKIYQAELNYLHDFILLHKNDAVIIAGDFNAWNSNRLELLLIMIEQLKLSRVNPTHDHLIKQFNHHHLDFIFYSGIKLESAQVINCDKLSDHNPILANFILSDTELKSLK